VNIWCSSVSDTGIGMSKEILARIFDPFFTTKEVGKGTGLGLATVYGIMKQNNGLIEVSSEPGQGSSFLIYLPRCRPDREDGPTILPKGGVPGGTEVIMMVEDEEPLLAIGRSVLEQRGYVVLPAGGPGEALEIARNHTGEIHLVITDVIMPEMNGRELVKKLLALRPTMKCLYTSGYTADVVASHGVLEKGVHFIEKPFSSGVLAERVRSILDRS
jgi:two-component system, cell cycle sensor histidine kinase and response regulator CckA